jgi:MOSC domain-containing protein YiiM
MVGVCKVTDCLGIDAVDEFEIETILVGAIAPLGRRRMLSAINKKPVMGRVRIGFLGIEGDEQADPSVHGGLDKAIHHYPTDHYAYWQQRYGQLPVLRDAGAFGENIAVYGIDESEASIGDVYRLGTALVEISQGRQPCWKQAERLGKSAVVTDMLESTRCGWYYRVLEEGHAEAGDRLVLVNRPLPQLRVARVIRLLIGGKHATDPAAVRALAGFVVLSESWRKRAHNLSKNEPIPPFE